MGDIILGKVVGKRPFGVFVRILSLVHGRNLDFHNIDIQVNINISVKYDTLTLLFVIEILAFKSLIPFCLVF